MLLNLFGLAKVEGNRRARSTRTLGACIDLTVDDSAMKTTLRNFIATLLVTIMLGINAAALDVCVRKKLKVKVINGRVVAPWQNTEEPIPNAAVKILKWHDEAYQLVAEVTANEQGQFSIDNVPSGEYEIEAIATGFTHLQVVLKLSKSSDSRSGKEIVMILEPKVGGCPGWAEVRKSKRMAHGNAAPNN